MLFFLSCFLLDPLLFEGLRDGSSDPAWHVIEVGRLSASGGGSGVCGAFTDATVEFSFGVIASPCTSSVVPPFPLFFPLGLRWTCQVALGLDQQPTKAKECNQSTQPPRSTWSQKKERRKRRESTFRRHMSEVSTSSGVRTVCELG